MDEEIMRYSPPWTIDKIREQLGDEIANTLAKDPVHSWRADTGIELIHKEPTREELDRIILNWKLMDYLKKRKSNKKSKELFGMTNLQHAKELLKESEFEKKADPPNRGLHDPNPAVAFAHKNFGFVPQVPWSYLAKANTLSDFDKVVRSIKTNGVRFRGPQEYDFLRRAGAIDGTYYITGFQKGPTTEEKFITLGSYPLNSDNVLNHELGHYFNDKDRGFSGVLDDQILEENNAWDRAGVSPDNELRRSAIATYENQNDKKKLTSAQSRMVNAAADTWASPKNTIRKMEHELPILHDYDTAVGMYYSNPLAATWIDNVRIFSDAELKKRRLQHQFPPGWDPTTGR